MRLFFVGFTLGIVWLQQQGVLWRWPYLAALAGLMLAVFLLKNTLQRIFQHAKSLALLVAGVMAGWVWASVMAIIALSHQLAPELEERDMTVVGVVTSLPVQAEWGQRFQFAIEQVITADVALSQLPNKVMLSWYSPNWLGEEKEAKEAKAFKSAFKSALQPGERWQLNVRLRRPHGLSNPHGFDYEVWLLEQGIGATGSVKKEINGLTNQRRDRFVFGINTMIERARGALRDRILAALPNHPYAPVIVALVTGEQNAISQTDWTIFARTGVSHLIAISGLHVTLLSGFFASVMFFLWRHSFFTSLELPLVLPAQKVAALSGVAMALLYVALAGFGIPAQRTLVMIAVTALACWFDRITSVTNVLCLALGAVVLIDPWAVLAPGFWLSFCAVGFLVYVSQGRHEMKEQQPLGLPGSHLTQLSLKNKVIDKVIAQLRQASVAQYAVTLGLLPLTMLLFNQVSVVSPIANAVAIPVVSFLITPFALIGSVLPSPLGGWILYSAHFILQQLLVFLAWLSEFSWAVWQLPRPGMLMFLCAVAGTLWMLAPKGWPLRWAGLLTWLPLSLNTNAFPPSNEFKVTVLDVGQGMALLVETAQHRLLYDTGPSYSVESNAGSSVIYPYLKMRGINQLDGLMVSHSDTDHSGGALMLMQQLKIDWVSSSLDLTTQIVQKAGKNSRHIRCTDGQRWDWDGVQFEILHPDAGIYAKENSKPNARSCTLKISNGTQSMLLAGDIEASQENQLLNRLPDKLQATVLLAPHHGSGTSSTIGFLYQVDPDIAVFQLGYHNRYHHPKSTVWQRYADLGISRLRTDQAGAITLHFSDTVQVEEHRVAHARYWHPKRDVESD